MTGSARGRAAARVAQVIVAVGLLALLLRGSSPAEIWALRGDIGFRYWAACVALLLLLYALGAASLLVLVEGGRRAAGGRFFLTYLRVQAVAQLTPAQAGEALLPFALRHAGVAAGETAAALVVQRLVGLAITVGAGLLFASHWLPPSGLGLLAALAAAGALALVWVVRSAWVRARLPRVAGLLAALERSWSRIAREHKRGLAAHVVLMTARFGAAAVASWTTFASFGMDVSLAEITGLCAAATLATLLPVSPAGLGVAEGVFVAALRPHGFGSERVLAACLAGRLLTAALLGAAALLYAVTPWRQEPPPSPEP